jgi:hypothetical protein
MAPALITTLMYLSPHVAGRSLGKEYILAALFVEPSGIGVQSGEVRGSYVGHW